MRRPSCTGCSGKSGSRASSRRCLALPAAAAATACAACCCGLGRDESDSLIAERGVVEVGCDFCGRAVPLRRGGRGRDVHAGAEPAAGQRGGAIGLPALSAPAIPRVRRPGRSTARSAARPALRAGSRPRGRRPRCLSTAASADSAASAECSRAEPWPCIRLNAMPCCCSMRVAARRPPAPAPAGRRAEVRRASRAGRWP